MAGNSTIDISRLLAPFDHIRTRKGPGGRDLSYVSAGDVIQRILDTTSGEYGWEVMSLVHTPGSSAERSDGRGGTRTFAKPGFWTVHGRMLIPGLGTRDGIGTAVDENEDGPKSAETDALKRAAVKFGVGLHLYRDDVDEAPATSANSSASEHRAAPRSDAQNVAQAQSPRTSTRSQDGTNSAPKRKVIEGDSGEGASEQQRTAVTRICTRNKWEAPPKLDQWTRAQAADWIRRTSVTQQGARQ